jgi:hypothetical protein
VEETIRIRTIEQIDWGKTLKGFPVDNIDQVLEVCGAEGQVVGTICASIEGKYYINGQPEVEYASLQAAAGALIQSIN